MTRRATIAEAQLRRATIVGGRGRLIVQRRRRAVRITAITEQAPAWTGKPSAASFAFVDLDDARVDRLVERLQAIRGGRRALRGEAVAGPQLFPGTLWLVVLKDKELRDEPDVGICLVEGTEDDAADAGRAMAHAAAEAGRGRCVPRWQRIDRGHLYRATALLRTPEQTRE